MSDRLGDLLVEAGVLTQQELDAAVARQATEGENRIASELHALGLARERDLCMALAKKNGHPSVILSESVIDALALGLVPKVIAERHQVMPLTVDADVLQVAVPDAHMGHIIEQIEFASGRRVVPYVAVKSVLVALITPAYEARARGDRTFKGATAKTTVPWIEVVASPSPNNDAVTLVEEIVLLDDDVVAAISVLDAPEAADDSVAMTTSAATDHAPAPHGPSSTIDAPTLDSRQGLGDVLFGAPSSSPSVSSSPLDEPTSPDVTRQSSRSSSESSAVAQIQLKQVAVVRPKTTPEPLELKDATTPVAVVIEDDDGIRKLISRALMHDGLTVEDAATGDAGVQILRRVRPSVIILDAMLPGVHGFEICSRAKQSDVFKNVPIIMISAVYRGWEQAREIQEVHGADAFIEKPFDVHFLRKMVATLLGKSLQRAALDEGRVTEIRRVRSRVESAFVYGDFPAATDAVKQWLALDPFDALAHLEAGNIHVQMGNLPWAMQSYETAVVYDANLFAAHLNLASVFERLGFWRRARVTWVKARDLAPDGRMRKELDQRIAALGA